ncbi:MAG: hypothetical protein HY308_03890 [Gammaproteobacteria bacterium]|nr:hypothetical protein [Gammaproteobacteria bacterium]
MSTLLVIIASALLFCGWLYFPYKHFADGGTGARFWSPNKLVAIAVLLSMGVVMLLVDWENPLTVWLSHGRMARRSFSAVWAVYGLPLWSVAVILFPQVARDLAKPNAVLLPTSSWPYALFGWVMLSFSCAVLLVLVNHR